jgi:pyruvate-formate lyase-activating enzyme
MKEYRGFFRDIECSDGFVKIRQIEEELEQQRRVAVWREKYMDFPAIVNIDTFTACNAKCDFCHQPRLREKGRYGRKMSAEIFEKTLSDLKPMPADLPLIFSPHWWNETFIDKDVISKMKAIVTELPQAALYITTNGALLTEKLLQDLITVPRIGTLKFSINYFEKAEYESVMKINFDTVIANLKNAVEEFRRKPFASQLKIGRVKDGTEKDAMFVDWVKKEFPDIPYVLFDYFPGFDKYAEPREPFFAPCRHWFELNVASDGAIGHCCVDSCLDFPWGNARDVNLLEIYNNPRLRHLRQNALVRQVAPYPCNNCNFNV